MPLYDLMLMLDPTAPGDRHDSILKDVQSQLENGGNIVTNQEWGVRKMTFEINHRPEADYHLLQFETAKGGELLERLDHSLKIMDGVLRHRIIRLKDGSPAPPVPRSEGRRESEGAPESAAPEAAAPADAVAPAEAAAPAAADAVAADAPDAGQPDAAPTGEPALAPEETPAAPEVAADEAPAPEGEDAGDETPPAPAAA
jgi:ribosomal protein S6